LLGRQSTASSHGLYQRLAGLVAEFAIGKEVGRTLEFRDGGAGFRRSIHRRDRGIVETEILQAALHAANLFYGVYVAEMNRHFFPVLA
jgi:hypothetical protein